MNDVEKEKRVIHRDNIIKIMKKIYNYLFPVFLSLFALAACDEDNEEIVSMSYTDPVATVTKIDPVEGYVGNEFTVSGSDFGIITEDVKVFIGSQEAVVVSCADDAILAKVPESATNGKITVEVFGQRVETDLVYRVLGKPGVSVVKPSYGFPGASLVFEGQEFVSSKTLYTLTFGTSTDKAEIVGTPTDTEFTAKVPETAVSGVMTLIMAEQTIDLASYPFTVLKHATLDTPAEVTIIGQNFGTKAENIQVFFGETVCDKVTLNDKGNIVVNVPKGVSSEAPVKIKLIIQGKEIEMGESGTFEVWATPEITSVETLYIYPYGTLVKAGQEITFTGKGFGTDKNSVTVTFEGISVPVTVKEITTTSITVTVPQGFNGGKVTMVFEGIAQPVESDILQPLPVDGDISQYVLMNYKQPFEYVKEGGDKGFHKKGEWAKAAYWIVQNSNLTAGEGGAAVDLAFKTKYGDGSDAGLALQTDWGFDNPKNDGKVYQTSHLQKGKYKLTAHVYEYDGRGFTGYVAVCKGNEMANTSDIPSKSLANASISGTGDVVVDILVEEPTDVVIGFVCTITVKQGRAKIDNFKLELVEQ